MTERAVVSVEGIFELEADRQAVAEFFRALEAEAGAGVDAGVEAEGVGLRGGIAVSNLEWLYIRPRSATP